MRTTKAVICLLFASVAFADINSDYEALLNGKFQVNSIDFDKLYNQFTNEFRDKDGTLPSSHYQARNANRKAIFNSKVMEIIQHNANPYNTYKKGINQFTDMTDDEFVDYYSLDTAAQECSATQPSHEKLKSIEEILKDVPAHWDWRDQGIVTPVKNQGKCGSCWTFSTVGCMESHFMMKYGQFRNLSEQQLVDCAQNYDNNGCSGGLPSHAFEYIKDNGGLTTEDKYPYAGVDQTCALQQGTQVVGVVGGSVNISLSEQDLQVSLFQHGPISVAFQVINGFRDYKTGVYTTASCKNGPMDVNHAVLAVGYGTENGVDYWIIKNSWADTWGDKGYFKMERGVNMCGIVNCNSYPLDVVDLSKLNEFLQ